MEDRSSADDAVTSAERPEEQVKDVLRYFQGELKLTGEIEGMGLGLAMISSVVWQVGGRITVDNRTDGPGVNVTMGLPRRNG